MTVYYLSGALFFFFLGFSVHKLHWYFLMSGYNTMSQEKKAHVDTQGLAKVFGIFGYSNAALLLLCAALVAFGVKLPVMVPVGFLLLSTVWLVIRSQKYDKNRLGENFQPTRSSSLESKIRLIIILFSLAMVAVLFFFSLRPVSFNASEESFKVSGMYSGDVKYADITELSLEDSLPELVTRVNGAAIGDILRGYFTTKNDGTILLLVDQKEPPFIYVRTAAGLTVFNLASQQDTRQAYELLKSKK